MWRTLFFIFLTGFVHAEFEVPDAKVEILHPKGFTVSIPHIDGIKLFAFHGKINEEMNGREAGYFSRDITSAKNGRWTFIDKTTTFKPGDVIYYWTYAEYFDGERKLGCPKDDQQFVVTEAGHLSGSHSMYHNSNTIEEIPTKPGIYGAPEATKPSTLGWLSTKEYGLINKLSHSQLQRYVLLEQLKLIQLQKEEILSGLGCNCDNKL